MPASGGLSTVTIWAIGLAISGLTSYLMTTGTMKTSIAVVEERESGHFQELQRGQSRLEAALKDMQTDIRYALGTRPTGALRPESDQEPPARAVPTPGFENPYRKRLPK